VEFVHNRAPHKTTGLSPFKAVYGVDPLTPSNLIPRIIEGKPSSEAKQRVKEIIALYERVGEKI